MSKTVWLITGAGRGMGTDIAKAALAAGHAVVAMVPDPGAGHCRHRSPDASRRSNKGRDLIAQADAYRDLSSSLAHDDD